jgi:flagellar hook assembly protein FlgD
MRSGITSPAAFRLIQNYPNPFNPSTTISFEIKETRPDYALSIYNNRGQLVKSLHRGELERGNHSLVWDGKDDNGTSVSSGVYYYKLSSRADNQIRKMVLVK